MAELKRPRPFPRGALLGAAALVGLALVSAATGRVTGIGVTGAPTAAPVSSRDLRFEDRGDGAVAVYDADTGTVVDVLPPGSNGFLRGVLRGLARDRKRQEIGAEPPFRLTRWADGRLSIEDTATQQRIELASFGPTNATAFARLLDDRSASQ
jgi:putative photosynthetic complex assembly protein